MCFSLRNTYNTDKNGVNKQNTNAHTPNNQSKITRERFSKYEIK